MLIEYKGRVFNPEKVICVIYSASSNTTEIHLEDGHTAPISGNLVDEATDFINQKSLNIIIAKGNNQ